MKLRTIVTVIIAANIAACNGQGSSNNSSTNSTNSISHSSVYGSTLGISNANANYAFLLTASSYSSDGTTCNGSCYGSLTPYAEQWVTLQTTSSWLQLDYDVCNGTNDSAIDYSGAEPKCATYMGHVGVKFTSAVTTLNDISGGTATLGPYKEGSPFTITFVSNTSIPTYDYPTTPSQYSTLPYRGVNLAGAEYDYAFQPPTLNDGAFYAQYGMNTIRLPFKWEYLQSNSTNTQAKDNNPDDPVDFNNPNAKAFAQLVEQYTQKGLTVIIDMHNYMRYGTNQAIIGNGGPTAQQYANAWVQIGTQFKDNKNVIFDLMNEPNTMSTQTVLDNYNVVIPALRNAGINNLVLLEGNGWTGASSWTSNSYDTSSTPLSNAQVFTPSAIKDPINNYAINVHQYFDSNYSGTATTCIANSIPDISGLNNYLTQYNLKAIITELGGANTSDCASDINQFLRNLPTSSYLGWTGWAGGTNSMSLTTYFGPLSDGSQTITMTNGFQPNLVVPNN